MVKKPFIKFIKIKNIMCYRNSIYYRTYKQLREIKKCGDFVIIMASFSWRANSEDRLRNINIHPNKW